MNRFLFTSESVAEGHPDKVCDLIADSILDAYLEKDPHSHVACEVLCKDCHVILAGEIKSQATGIDPESIVRAAIREIGYTDPSEAFHAEGVRITNLLGAQSMNIDQGVSGQSEQGAGDQGLMFGYATNETPELMPWPILLAHRLARQLAKDRKEGCISWARPDAKTQVTVRYENDRPVQVTDVVVSTQHRSGTPQETIRDYVREVLLPQALDGWFRPEIRLLVNPTGEFAIGGPAGDCGVTGRKIIVDTYGGFARHGGGAFSGKDPSKVDRSAAYFARHVARQIVKQGIARRAELQISYAIGVAQPISLSVNTFGTGDAEAAQEFASRFDFRPAAIAQTLGLLRPIYRQTTNYGHFGKPELPWER
jgi:S-adenosylmethionine synthetase